MTEVWSWYGRDVGEIKGTCIVWCIYGWFNTKIIPMVWQFVPRYIIYVPFLAGGLGDENPLIAFKPTKWDFAMVCKFEFVCYGHIKKE